MIWNSSAAAIAATLAVSACGSSEPRATDPIENAAVDPAVDVSPPHLIIVVQGTYAWMGNDTYETGSDDAPIVAGGYKGLARALDRVATFKAGNIVALLIATGDEPRGRELYGGSLAGLDGKALGDQKAFENDIAIGLETALHAIETKLANEDGRKVMVIIGDGGDVMEAFDPAAAAVRLRRASFEVYTIYYSAQGGNAGSVESARTLGFSGHHIAASPDDIAAHLAAIHGEAFGPNR